MLQFDLGAPWREMSFVSVDVETTGFSTESCRVTEIGIVRFDRGQLADRWGSLVNPGQPIPEEVTKVTGITDEMVKDKPSFRDLKWEVYGRLRDRIFVAYNVPFDWGFLEMELERCGLTLPDLPRLDPLVWARQMMPSERSHKLGKVCERLGVSLLNAHRAEDDAEAAGKVLLRFADKVPVDLRSLLAQQAQWATTHDEARAARKAARRAARGGEPEAEPKAEPKEVKQTGLF